MSKNLKFIDLFAGLGGFHKALSRLGHKCEFASEINEELRALYQQNFGMRSHGDIHGVDPKEIPPHNILCAGFPCQPFSKAGDQLGLKDELRGTLFGNIVKIVKEHKPEYLILENVGNFERHDKGHTWATVRRRLERLGYDVRATEHKATGGPGLLSPHHLGFPHHRERFYIVASRNGLDSFSFPMGNGDCKTKMSDVVDDELSARDLKETEITDQQRRCIEHWNRLLMCLTEEKVPDLPSFPIWGDELWADYPYEVTTPLKMSDQEFDTHLAKVNSGMTDYQSRQDYLDTLPAYATRSEVFPPWKIRFIDQNRAWFRRIKKFIPNGWEQELKEFPPSLRKLEWNCKGETRDLWDHILQFRSSGLRVKRYQNSPSLVAMTETQIPILGPKQRFISRGEGLRLQGFPPRLRNTKTARTHIPSFR